MMNKISPISFQGLKIEGVVSSKNFKKLGEFTNAIENKGFIIDLEKDFNTHLVLNNTLDEISFLHQEYGSLTNYGCPKFPAKDFYSHVVNAMDSVKSAIKKAEKTFQNSYQDYNTIRRGC